ASAAVLPVMALARDTLAQGVEPAVEVAALGGGEARPRTTILRFKPAELPEFGAQFGRLRPGQGAVADALIDPPVEVGLALVDRLPGRGVGDGGNSRGQGGDGGQGHQDTFHESPLVNW